MSADPDTGVDIEADADAETDIEMDTDDDEIDVDIRTANTMRERADQNRVVLWVLLSANRLYVTAGLALVIFVAFIIVVSVLSPPFQSQLMSSDTLETLFSTMIGAIITGTTLVITISQLVLDQENGSLGEQRERMENTMDYRTYTRDLIDRPLPADPAEFLQQIITATERRANALRNAVAGNDDDQLRAEVDEFTDSLTENAEAVKEQLDGGTFGSFDVISAALGYNYSWKIFQVERIAYEHDESLSEEDTAILNELKTALSMFGPAREHIRTLYLEWVLVTLSKQILYVAIPALAVAGITVAIVDAGTFPGSTVGIANVIWVVGGAFTLTLLPFLLFASYIWQIVTITQRTLAIGPLILRESQR
ncbi:MAG TPA: hypothetical protein VFJ06_00895 [Halococcus sp.]|nr:hypothetical protein [Halococcus sp.]